MGRRSGVTLLLLVFVCSALHAASPATRNNDDSCDISVAPAATLLLPYFEVDLSDRPGEMTLFTITNVTALPQIARVTIWTDWSYPLLTFNLFLTGYDVQSINLYDVLARGRIASETSMQSEVGVRSADNDTNPMHAGPLCAAAPDPLPVSVLEDLRSALTVGRNTACASARIGSTHAHAIGYATIDVVRNCGSAMPVDAGYFTSDLGYDNVLIGDYQQVDRMNNFAQGNTLVHIRAVPEEGVSGWPKTNLRRTFYSRLQNGGTADRRQPLPSTFAARWIDGGVGELNAAVKIWREPVTGATAGCALSSNARSPLPDIVRFDDEENPAGFVPDCTFLCPEFIWDVPTVQRIEIDNSGWHIPPDPNRHLAGWMYYNPSRGSWSAPSDEEATQGWVVVSMAAEGRFSVDFDATSLGNGCGPRTPYTAEDGSSPVIGPSPNVNP
jgi:hypothetical protein